MTPAAVAVDPAAVAPAATEIGEARDAARAAATVEGPAKEVMEEAETDGTTVGKGWTGRTNQAMAQKEETELWRLLKHKTEGDAKKVVLTAEEGAGFGAWQALCKRMGPGLEARKAKVLAEVSTVGGPLYYIMLHYTHPEDSFL